MKLISCTSQSLLSLTVLSFALSLHAAQPDPSAPGVGWNKVSDGKIDFYTPDDPQAAGDLLQSFDDLTAFFKQAGPFTFSDQSRLVIVAFHSAKDFSQYRMNAGSCAFYQQTEKGEYVVLQDLLPEHRSVSAHEFTHFLVAHSDLKLPLWLNEGIADTYSTLSIQGDQAQVGAPVPGRLKLMRHHSWLTLPSLFAIGTASEYYSDPSKMEVFYSESWVLTHMLALSPGYAAHFPAFLHSISEGRSPAESLQLNFHKSLSEVEADLHDYVDHGHLSTVTVALRLAPTSGNKLRVTTASNSDVDVALSDLTLANPSSKADIQSRLTNAAKTSPEDARAEEALGFMAMKQGKIVEARTHFHKAIDRHSDDAGTSFYAAHYDRDAGVADDQVLPLLRRALELKPAYYEAHLELAMVATSSHNYDLALATLATLDNPRPEHAYAIAYSLAYCYAQTEKLAQARQYLAKARQLASSDHDRADLDNLRAFVEDQQEFVSDRGAEPVAPRH